MRVGALDIGTNTLLLLVAEQRGDSVVPIVDRATITRLGEGVDRTRRLADAACDRSLACLAEYAAELRELGVTRVEAVGTSALRDAEGGARFLDRAEAALGVRPRVIDGLEEAELTFHGALSGLSQSGALTVFDVGGGSTEIILGRAGPPAALDRAVSLDVGSVRLFERHVRADPPAPDELEACRGDIEAALTGAPRPSFGSALVGVAGTVTTLAAIDLGLSAYEPSRVHGHVLGRERIEELAERLAGMTVAARRALAGLEPKRADVIVVGAEIVRRVLAWSGARELVVSDRGVRWGLAERLARETAP